ncbi:MAG: ABC transporter permease [Clostridia bacterium]|nr:ABC transporter permease [Clostridia bacterium]
MKRALIFAKRNMTELLRDPLSYIFCLGFPIVMLAVMTLVNESIPAESSMTLFRIDNLYGGIVIFGQFFIMLSVSLRVASDRRSAFLIRLFATPMKPFDFTAGYILPMTLTCVMQTLVSFCASYVIAAITGYSLPIGGMLLSVAVSALTGVFFTALGFIAGTLLSDHAAPAFCSILISVGSFLGCIWFDADSAGGVLLTACRVLPFYYCTKAVRAAVALDITASSFFIPLAVIAGSAAVTLAIAIAAFHAKMRSDNN